MPASRSARIDPERHQRLLDIAADELAEHGPANASINRILVQAGVSKGSFYHAFPDKAALLGAVVEAEILAMSQGLAPPPAADAQAWWEGILHALNEAMARLEAHPRTAVVLRHALGQGQALPEDLLAPFEQWLDHTLQEGASLGAVRTDVPTALLRTSLLGMGVAADRWLLDPNVERSATEMYALSTAVLDMMRKMVAPD